MAITLTAGEQKRLDLALSPVEVGFAVFDVFLTTNYVPPSAADNYIHARIRNNSAVAKTHKITAYYWESWMSRPPYREQIIALQPGQTVEYHEYFHGNNYLEYDMKVWLMGDWTSQPLTRDFKFHAGYFLKRQTLVEGHVVEVGRDHVILRYAQYGTCTNWEYAVYTPPLGYPNWEQYLSGMWRTDWAYCSFWLIPNLLPNKQYEAHLEGSSAGGAHRETRIQFRTLS